MKTIEIFTSGVISETPSDIKKDVLILKRIVDENGDVVMIAAQENKENKIVYMITTESLKKFLDEPLEKEN